MDPLIRAPAINHEPLRLERRREAAPAKVERGPLPAAVTVPAAPVVDLEAQRAWQREAERELAAAREREEQRGHAAGHAQGLADAQAAYRDKLAHLEQLIENAGRSFSAQIEGLEDIAVSIAFESLAKLLGDALVTREGVRAIVSQVLQCTKEQERLIVRLSPSDFYLLLQQASDAPLLAQTGVELVPDDRIELGGCLVETGTGSLDARLETQMQALRRVLLRSRHERGGAGGAA
jgi:flagellar assembly protein FliH